MRKARSVAATAALAGCALAAAGCGGGQSGAGSTATPSATATPSSTAATSSGAALPHGLTTRSTSIGTVLATGSGRTVYELVGATPSHSACTGSCLSIWPPVKANGRQLVVGGHPLYRFAGDHGPGQVNGQGLKDTWGKWWALNPAGKPITTATGSPSPTSGGGY